MYYANMDNGVFTDGEPSPPASGPGGWPCSEAKARAFDGGPPLALVIPLSQEEPTDLYAKNPSLSGPPGAAMPA